MHQTLQHSKFQDFKYDNSIFKLQPKIRILGIFFSPKSKDFYFPPKFAIKQTCGCSFQIWQWFFRISVKKYPNKAFFVVNLTILLFLHETSHIEKFEGTDFDNGNSFFQIPAKNTLMRNFLWKLKTFFFLCATLSEPYFI